MLENASPLEKSKHDLCENILAYKQDNKLTIKKLSQQFNLSEAEIEDMLYYRINHFTFDRLMNYANKLFSLSQVKFIIEKKVKTNNRIHV